jgi:hypothetical protein
MTGVVSLIAEEPLCGREDLYAVDEASDEMGLAEFVVAGACRYSFVWKRFDKGFAAQSVVLLRALAELMPQPMSFVAGWYHDAHGSLRIRHMGLTRALGRGGWEVHAEEKIGVAVTQVTPDQVPDSISFAVAQGLSWFVGFGESCSASLITQPPFRETARYFAWRARAESAVRGGAEPAWRRGGLHGWRRRSFTDGSADYERTGSCAPAASACGQPHVYLRGIAVR